ncbi:MAG: hypothetical protein JKY54_18440 [Flavobacteriales bacterium]|nr:hypothetical protein [Flavobacteriales bacterium]
MPIETPVKLQQVIREFEELRVSSNCSHTVTIDLMLTILEVGKGNGVTGRDVEELLGISQSKAMRTMDVLRKEKRNGGRGFDLIKEKKDPTNHRAIVRLPNARLKAFMEKINAHLE